MNRRHFLKTGAAAFLSSQLWPGRLRAAENGKGDSGWTFIAVNDLHYEEAACGPWFEKIVTSMKTSAPGADFLIIGGDLANRGLPAQLAPIRDIFSKIGMPVYTTPGNHDWSEESTPTRKAYDDLYPGATNLTFEHRGWQFIGLDTTDSNHWKDTTIHEPAFAWLDTALPKIPRDRPVVLYTHFPLGEGVKYRPKNAGDLLARFKDYNLQSVFNGHYHAFTEKTWAHSILTTDRCCSRVRANHDGTKEKGWFVCTAKDGQIHRDFIQIPADLLNQSATPAPIATPAASTPSKTVQRPSLLNSV